MRRILENWAAAHLEGANSVGPRIENFTTCPSSQGAPQSVGALAARGAIPSTVPFDITNATETGFDRISNERH